MVANHVLRNSWSGAPATVVLGDDAAHVWLVQLGAEYAAVEALAESLSSDERQRAGRFKFTRDRRRFIVAHAALRSVLGAYLSSPPAEIIFCAGENGKPALAPSSAVAGLEFNLSHSHEVALVAVTRQREVGIDVEFTHREFEFGDLARRFFTAAEVTSLEGLPAYHRRDAFFRCWTSKEAFLKARGTGLAGAMDEVRISPMGQAGVAVTASVPGWQLLDLPAIADYQAALVLAGDCAPPVITYRWDLSAALDPIGLKT